MSDQIKTLIITDYMGTSVAEPEEEAVNIARLFKQDFDIDLNWTHQTAANNLENINPKLIIIDYGGLLPGSDVDIHQMRAVLNWAQDHPSRLVLIWTSFTANIWKYELEDEFKEADNVLLWEPGESTHFFSFDEAEKHQAEVVMKIRHWYNLPKPKPPDLSEYHSNLKTPPGRKKE